MRAQPNEFAVAYASANVDRDISQADLIDVLDDLVDVIAGSADTDVDRPAVLAVARWAARPMSLDPHRSTVLLVVQL